MVPSPVDEPGHPGSLGAAISDAVRDAVGRPDSHYSLGSVLNHVVLHQTVIGQEAKAQLALAGEERPDVVIGCCGGGSNLGGISLPFVTDERVRLLAVEPASCPTLTAGRYEYDFGDTAGFAPLLLMYTLGRLRTAVHPCRRAALPRRRPHHFRPGALGPDAGRGLPAVQDLRGRHHLGADQGTVPAPETGHAIRAVIDEALAAKRRGPSKVILFNYSGHGLLDLSAYDAYLQGSWWTSSLLIGRRRCRSVAGRGGTWASPGAATGAPSRARASRSARPRPGRSRCTRRA